MPKLKNYYKILEVPAFSDAEVVKTAYRKLARQYHPDVSPDNKAHEEKFKLINEAYETLRSGDKKALYDESLRVLLGRDGAPSSGNVHKGSQQASSSATAKKAYGDQKDAAPKKDTKPDSTPINELFESFIKKGFQQEKEKTPPPKSKSTSGSGRKTEEPIFRTGKESGGSTASGTPKRGRDESVDTIITPAEAESGVVKTVHIQHNDMCRRCSGTGKVGGSPCTGCDGNKVIVRTKKIDVRIPAGVKQGSKVRVAGEGGRGQGGGENGDLFLSIKIEVDPSLKIEGMDVHSDMNITLPEAALGKEVQVPTLHGPVRLTIPPLTSSGKTLRLKDQGVHNGALKGDHYVTIKILAPQSLTPEEKSLYEKLLRLQGQ